MTPTVIMKSLCCLMVILAIALNSEAENRFIEIPALGRPFSLGDLYDMTKDTRIEGPKLWEQKKLDDFVQEGTPNTDSDIIAAESFSEQKSKFDINARIGMSFLSGLIKVEGSAGYLDDRIKTSNTARVSLRFMSKTYKRSFKPETLTIVDYPQVLKKVTEATHVVAGIQYGAGAIFVFDRHINNNEVKKDVQGSMNIAVKSIPGFEISGEGKVIMTEEDKKNDDRFSCSFHGDFVLKNQPTSYKEAILVYKELPGLLGDNYENAVPMTIFLYPLDALPLDKAAAVLQEIKSTVVAQVTKEIETLDSIIRSCNDILGTDVAYYHERIRRNVADFQKYVEDYKGLFQEDLQKVLPKIRNNTLPDSALTALLNDKSDSPFSSLALETWIEDLKKETGVLQETQNLPNYCKDDGELSRKLLKGPEYSIVLHLKLDTMEDEYLTKKMKKYIEDKRKVVDTFSFLSFRYKWWAPSSQTFQDLIEKKAAFEAYYNEESKKTENMLKSDVQFLVLESPLDPDKKGEDRGVFVEVYRKGLLSERDYAIPFMSSKPVAVKTKFDQILLSWDKPEKSENVFFYEISPFVRNDTAKNMSDLYIPLATIQTSGHIDDKNPNIRLEYIKNLKSDQAYYFKVSVYCKTRGKTSTSIESELIQTEPCPSGMFHKDPHTCELCPSGHYNERVGAKNCLTCPEGTYRAETGAKSADECQPCPQGTYNDVQGLISVSSCKKCPAGTYNDKERSVSNADCVRCPPGTYSEMIGQTSRISCIPCKAGTYNENEGATRCVLCPEGTSSKTQGAKGQDECGEGATTTKLELEMAGIKTELGDLSANVASIQGLKTEIGDLSANVARIQGMSAIVARIQGYESLRGKCFHHETGESFFDICPYGENRQKTYSIGTFKGWKDGVIGGTMLFADGNGVGCGSFGKRRSEIIFTCGDFERIRVLEPETCYYVIKMQTKFACGELDMKNEHENCWDECGEKSGPCDSFCGTGACCRRGYNDMAPCDINHGCEDNHCCTKISEPEVKNEHENCWDECGEKSGPCDRFCGTGACCRRGYNDMAPCDSNQGCVDYHCCTRISTGWPVDFTKESEGRAKASSIHAVTHGAKMAFVESPLPWANNAKANPIGGSKPVRLIWEFLTKDHLINKFGFSSRKDCCLDQSPTKFDFLASKNCDGTWEVLASIETKFTTLNQAKLWNVPKEKQNFFRCYAINVKTVSRGPTTAIGQMKLYTSAVDDDRLKKPGHRLADLAQKSTKSFTPKIATKGTWPWS